MTFALAELCKGVHVRTCIYIYYVYTRDENSILGHLTAAIMFAKTELNLKFESESSAYFLLYF